MTTHMDIKDVMGALARGYCAEGNTHKEMDVDLCAAQAVEVMKLVPQGVDAMPDDRKDPYADFQRDLSGLLNTYSLENRTNTPDFILADFVVENLRALEHQHHAKKAWNTAGIVSDTMPTTE